MEINMATKTSSYPVCEMMQAWHSGNEEAKNAVWTFLRPRFQNMFDHTIYMLYDIYGREELTWNGVTAEDVTAQLEYGLLLGLNHFRLGPDAKNGNVLTRQLHAYCNRYISGEIKRVVSASCGISPYYTDMILKIKKAGYGYKPAEGWFVLADRMPCTASDVHDETGVSGKTLSMIEKSVQAIWSERRNAPSGDTRAEDFENRMAEYDEVRSFLCSLKSRDRKLFLAYFLDGKSFSRIAEKYELPKDYVRGRVMELKEDFVQYIRG